MPPKKKRSGRVCWILLEEGEGGGEGEGEKFVPSCANGGGPLEEGYILNKVLFTRPQEHVENDIIKDNGDTVYIHPDTMRQCDIKINQTVIIMNSDYEFLSIARAWPIKSIDIHRVTVSKSLCEKVKNDSLILIKLMPSNIKIFNIKELELSLRSSPSPSSDCITNDESFRHYIAVKNEGTIVSVGSSINVTFLGQLCSFVVKSLHVSHDSSRLSHDSSRLSHDSSSISLDISSLSLSSVLSSTPSKPHPLTTPTPASPLQAILPQIPLQEIGRIAPSTIVTITTSVITNDSPSTGPTLDDIGGYSHILLLLKQLVQYPFVYPHLVISGQISFPFGIIIHGLSGTGKSLIVEAVCRTVPFVNIKIINSSDLLRTNALQLIELTLQQLESGVIDILIVNDIDKVCLNNQLIVSALIKHFETVARSPALRHSVVMATTNNLSSVHIELRCPGRFDKEIEIHPPQQLEREDILRRMIDKIPHTLSKEDIASLSMLTHGYVGSDLKLLCTTAQQLLLSDFDPEQSFDFHVNYDVMLRSLRVIQPTAMKEIMIEVPKVRAAVGCFPLHSNTLFQFVPLPLNKVLWSDIGGEENIKKQLIESTDWPIKHPQALERLGLRPVRGILLYGPPGCSKTMIVRALATETCFNFISIKGPEIFNKWVGDSEKAIRKVFSRARAAAPSIVFFDEIDSIATHRQSGDGSKVGDRILTQLLTEMDGIESLKGVLVIAATNRPDIIDKALLRTGRFDKKIYVPLPTEVTRREIFKIRFKTTPVSENVDVNDLVLKTAGYSGAEVVAVVERAAELALSDDISCCFVSKCHFDMSVKEVLPGTDAKLLSVYETFQSMNK